MKSALFAVPFLLGTWFGTGQPNDKQAMWIAYMKPNGVFAAHFRSCVKGQEYDEMETGRWRLEGDMETINILTVNGKPFAREDRYKVLSHDDRKQVYRYLADGFVFTSRRVDEKFEMPSCEAIS